MIGYDKSTDWGRSPLLDINADSNMRLQLNRTPISYKLGSATFRVQTKFVTAVSLVGVGALLLLYVLVPSSRTTDSHSIVGNNNALQYKHFLKSSSDPVYHSHKDHLKEQESISDKQLLNEDNTGPCSKPYNSTYPLTPPVTDVKRGLTKYRIAVVADLDTDSKDESGKSWHSYLKMGYLIINKDHSSVKISWDEKEKELKSKLSYEGRGLELSELIVFDGKVLSVDDRTGVIYQIDTKSGEIVPWVILTDGDGNSEKGFKSEWATIRDGLLYVGGLGKEWTTSTGELVNHNPQWVKTINTDGKVEHQDWSKHYIDLRAAVNIQFPGYMIHEAVAWSPVRSEWVFLPRRASPDKYDDKIDEHKGSDLILTATEDFSSITAEHVGKLVDTHGFSSFKFIPDTDDEVIIALKSEEVDGTTATYIMAFDRDRKVILEETKIGDVKYEGIEFV